MKGPPTNAVGITLRFRPHFRKVAGGGEEWTIVT